MKNRSHKIISLLDGSRETDPVPVRGISKRRRLLQNDGQTNAAAGVIDMESSTTSNNKVIACKKKIDDQSIWTHFISLDDMDSIRNKKFEYENSYNYIKDYDILRLKSKLLNDKKPLSAPLASELTEKSIPPSCSPALINLLCDEEMIPSVDILSNINVETDGSSKLQVTTTKTDCLNLPITADATSNENNENLALSFLDCSEPDFDQISSSSSTSARNVIITGEDEGNRNTVQNVVNAETEQTAFSQFGYKKKKTNKKEKNRLKHEKNLTNYKIREPCKNLCKKLCTIKFTEAERVAIHDYYWSLDWEHRGLYVKRLVANEDCKKKSKNPKKSRNVTYKYSFPKEDNMTSEVCKTFFLCTLGYDKKNDRHINTVLSKPITEQMDKRDGRNLTSNNTVNKVLLTDHIESFNPQVHHYRREHAPNKRYLSSDIKITHMHQKFLQLYPNEKCSLETYRDHVTNVMGISFALLGHEECEICEIFHLHNPEHVKNGTMPDCNSCKMYTAHKSKYTKARAEYNADAAKNYQPEILYYSVDMQKVIMLPRMDNFKAVIFCPRVVVYNETFVPLGNSVFAAIWHEAISGRKQEDIVSTFRAFFIDKRDAKLINIWLDNCSAQNKNWCLFTFLIYIIKSSDISAEQIVFKFFEPGHTFMSADSFHRSIEESMKTKGKVYDFTDFVDSVKNALRSGTVVAKTMHVSDFYLFKSHMSQRKLKDNEGKRVYLKNIVEVMVQRGKYSLFFKNDFSDIDYKHCNCLKSKNFPIFHQKTNPRGIDTLRKQKIVKELGPLMPNNRLLFWKNIPTNDETEPKVTFDLDETDTEN